MALTKDIVLYPRVILVAVLHCKLYNLALQRPPLSRFVRTDAQYTHVSMYVQTLRRLIRDTIIAKKESDQFYY